MKKTTLIFILFLHVCFVQAQFSQEEFRSTLFKPAFNAKISFPALLFGQYNAFVEMPLNDSMSIELRGGYFRAWDLLRNQAWETDKLFYRGPVFEVTVKRFFHQTSRTALYLGLGLCYKKTWYNYKSVYMGSPGSPSSYIEHKSLNMNRTGLHLVIGKQFRNGRTVGDVFAGAGFGFKDGVSTTHKRYVHEGADMRLVPDHSEYFSGLFVTITAGIKLGLYL